MALAITALSCSSLSRPPSHLDNTHSGQQPLGFGLATLSVASARETPGHKAELGTQILMGHPITLLSRTGSWYQVRSADGYVAWVERGLFAPCTENELSAWTNSPDLLMVTVLEDVIREKPDLHSLPVSDVVIANVVKQVGGGADWYRVQLPDNREGFLPRASVRKLSDWREHCKATAENIETTALRFLGRPYLWGGTSPKGLDCSGFTKLVFHLNGIELPRNASQQASVGEAVSVDPQLDHLRKGDLVFFGPRRRGASPERPGARITHVGIYLGGPDKQFIHSYERVQISSLLGSRTEGRPDSIRQIVTVRRVLP
jgi:SH3-like domain-containing protein